MKKLFLSLLLIFGSYYIQAEMHKDWVEEQYKIAKEADPNVEVFVKKTQIKGCTSLHYPMDHLINVVLTKCNGDYTLVLQIREPIPGKKPRFQLGDIQIHLSQEEGKRLFDIFDLLHSRTKAVRD